MKLKYFAFCLMLLAITGCDVQTFSAARRSEPGAMRLIVGDYAVLRHVTISVSLYENDMTTEQGKPIDLARGAAVGGGDADAAPESAPVQQ